MAADHAFHVEGVVTAVLPQPGLYRARLANGHELLAHLAGRARREGAALVAGQKVNLELSPYDLSVGRIRTEEK
jgi:translation initiation factor IF-1